MSTDTSFIARIAKITKECDGVWSTYGITSWERTFLQDNRSKMYLSPRQVEILDEIEAKVKRYTEDDGDDDDHISQR